jgi:hypothetical protein
MPKIEVESGDLEQVLDALASSRDYFQSRDAAKAVEQQWSVARPSPLCLRCNREVERLAAILNAIPSDEL